MPRASVVLCTRNRADMLEGAVVAIQQAAVGHDVELVIVDNGSTDATPQIAARLAEASTMPLRVELESAPGLCRARNKGIAAAVGDLIVFTDDDCRVKFDYFTKLFSYYDLDREPVLRGGRVELGDPTDKPFTIKTDDQRTVFGDNQHPGGFIHGCNMIVPREVFERVGRFDERFGAGAVFKAADDSDLIERARRGGYSIEYVPDVTTYHFHGRNSPEEIAGLSRNYQIGNGALHAKFGIFDRFYARYFYWNVRNAVREWFGGPLLDDGLGLSHRSLVADQVTGMLAYWRSQR